MQVSACSTSGRLVPLAHDIKHTKAISFYQIPRSHLVVCGSIRLDVAGPIAVHSIQATEQCQHSV